MATPSESLPFEVCFREGNGLHEVKHQIAEFCLPMEVQAWEEPMVVLTENLPLRLVFQTSDSSARLYMDGLESVPEERLQEDAAGYPYLTSGTLNLFSYGNYGWIPGLYWLQVVLSSGRYFALVEVQPKEMSMSEWTAMRDELQAELQGLALELVRRNLGLAQSRDALPSSLLHRFLVVRLYFPKLMSALADLRQQANHRVRTIIRWLPTLQSRRMPIGDFALTHPKKRDLTPTAVTILDYDLPENRWVKRIVRATINHLRRFQAAAQPYLRSLDAEIAELSQYLHQSNTEQLYKEKLRTREAIASYQSAASKMLWALQWLGQADWYEQVGDSLQVGLPHALLTDGPYHTLHSFYRQLRQEEWQPSIADSYGYQWKRTDKLYEIWCVIRLCKLITAVGWQPVSGWLFDFEFQTADLLVADLPPNTCISWRRGGNELHLIYDQEIPRQSSECTPLQCPVYTQDVHNRPDIRLDLFTGGSYAGCVVLDCKYRPLRGFWKPETLATGYDRPKAMSQLISYGMAIRSPYLDGETEDWVNRRAPAALEVWALHPGSPEQPDELYIPDHRVRIFSLRPGLSPALLSQRLQEKLSSS